MTADELTHFDSSGGQFISEKILSSQNALTNININNSGTDNNGTK
jgi:hypothetical protein